MKEINLFISYSHLDEAHINEFRKHISPLTDNDLLADWYDRKILAGEDFQDSIDNNLSNADVICLFISANFLSSSACKKEKSDAFELKRKKGISVVPIILSACGWLDEKDISPKLALPIDGDAIDSFEKSSDGWHEVYKGLKPVVAYASKVANVKVRDEFEGFLQSTEMLTKSHAKKETVLLDDVFTFPDLKKYDDLKDFEKSISSENLIENITDYSKVLLAGENQSGKTTLCKMMYISLRNSGYFPVYISDRSNYYLGKMENKITSAFSQQYEGINFDEVRAEMIVPIVDDFHFAKHKEKSIQELAPYHCQVVVVDDIFSLNIQDESTIQSYTHFKIKELHPSLRNKLIEKWSDISGHSDHHKNAHYKELDKTTELVNQALGAVIGGGIMPAYPFFILSVISTSEAFGSSLEQEITSQGYCYQALIFLYLRKQGVRNDDVDTYINFLTEFAFWTYSLQKDECSENDFKLFMESYLNKYNLPISKEILLRNLQEAQLVECDSFGSWGFRYLYLYYFFVAKYLAEHIEKNKEIVDGVIANLQKDENSYIAIFISHHTKSPYLLDEVTLSAMSLFEKYEPAVLDKKEIQFIDDQADILVKEALPAPTSTPEQGRSKILVAHDAADEKAREEPDEEDSELELAIEMRRSIKTVEVMGLIIKNRAGSLDKDRLDSIFEEAIKVHLRSLTSFFELIDNEDDEIVEYISNRLEKVFSEKDEQRASEGKKVQKRSSEDMEKVSRRIYWNMNFFFIYGLLNKIVHSVGSDKLIDVIERVCDKEDTPAANLIKHGILMWYNKNLQIGKVTELVNKEEFSETAKKVLRFMVVNHCTLHDVDFKDRQKIHTSLEIPLQKLLVKQ